MTAPLKNQSQFKVLIDEFLWFNNAVYKDVAQRICASMEKCNKTVHRDFEFVVDCNWTNWMDLFKIEGYDVFLRVTDVTYGKHRMAKFSSALYTETIRFVSMNPKEIPKNLARKLFQIEPTFLDLFVFALFLASVLLAVDHLICNNHVKSRPLDDSKKFGNIVKRTKQIASVLNFAYYLIPSLFLKESRLMANSITTRITFGSWLIFCFFVINGLLCFQKADQPTMYEKMNDLEDVIKKPEMAPFFDKNHYAYNLLQSQNSDSGRKIIDRAKGNGGVFDTIMELNIFLFNLDLNTPFVALFLDPFYYSYDITDRFRNFDLKKDEVYIGEAIIGEELMTYPFSEKVSSPCMEVINLALLRMFESEIVVFDWKKNKYKWDRVTFQDLEDSFRVLTFQDEKFLLVIGFVSLMFSLSVLFVEILRKTLSDRW